MNETGRASAPRPPADRRKGCLAPLMILFGGVLLLPVLPGVCVLGLFFNNPTAWSTDATPWVLLLLCLAATVAAVALIWRGAKSG